MHLPPSTTVADGFVWRRGALDLKYSIVGLLEAFSQLILQW
jgi:acetylornithine deacetylase/succinyl-diaminopimelate desuccinylase-like protein